MRPSIRCRELIAALLLAPGAAHAFDAARDTYLTRCGGCHGIEGVSVPQVPTLRGRAGRFLCSTAGRAYVLHLPNVAMSRIDDDALLASVLNFVAFGLGGDSAPAGAARFGAAEVRDARAAGQEASASSTARLSTCGSTRPGWSGGK